MKVIVIDTDVLINCLRGQPKAKAALLTLAEEGIPSCSAITVAEILAGMKEHERQATESLIRGLQVISVDQAVAEKAGAYKRTIKSHALELDDCLIAATAFVHKALLATGNARHYPMTDVKKLTMPSA
jgi:predicted nucleic acid-binding protein